MPPPSPNPHPSLVLIKERALPILSEALDGFVIIGFAADVDGPKRVTIYHDNNNEVMRAALAPLLAIGAAWSNPPPPSNERPDHG